MIDDEGGIAATVDERLQRLVQFIFEEHEHDTLNCESCSEQFAHLSELVAHGANLHDLMPAVEGHLDCCPECREQYEALLCIIRAELNGTLPLQPTSQEGS